MRFLIPDYLSSFDLISHTVRFELSVTSYCTVRVLCSDEPVQVSLPLQN